MCAAILVLQWQGENYFSGGRMCQKKRYVTKGIQPIFKNFPLLKDVENRYLGRKHHERLF